MGAVFAGSGKREGCPVHVILLRNLPRERHTGQTKKAVANPNDGLELWVKMKSHRPPLEGGPPRTGGADDGAHGPVDTMPGLARQGTTRTRRAHLPSPSRGGNLRAAGADHLLILQGAEYA